jgi:hypothetical protein
MAKKKKNDAPEVEQEKKPLIIIGAKMRDGFCDYKIHILKGPQIGDKVNVTGAGKVTDDMYDAFRVLNRHFACIDDVFQHNGIEVENIDAMENHELTGLYVVDGIKISGPEESESVELMGSKHLSIGGRATFPTPKIAMDQLSGYKWYNELKSAVDTIRKEVELYREGKTIIEENEEVPDPKQIKMFTVTAEESGDDFNAAKL